MIDTSDLANRIWTLQRDDPERVRMIDAVARITNAAQLDAVRQALGMGDRPESPDAGEPWQAFMTDAMKATLEALPPNGKAMTIADVSRITGQALSDTHINLLRLSVAKRVSNFGKWWCRSAVK